MAKQDWSDKDIDLMVDVLRQSKTTAQALETLSTKLKRPLTATGLRSIFLRRGLPSPTELLQRREKSEPSDASTQAPEPEPTTQPKGFSNKDSTDSPIDGDAAEIIGHIIKWTKKKPLPFAEICDRLDKSPKRVRDLIQAAIDDGMHIRVENDHVGFGVTPVDPRVIDIGTGIPPVVGAPQRVAVISDTHLGSKYCLREQLKDFIHHVYKEGIRDILHPGDVLDGMYRHGVFEVTHVGLEAQMEDLLETLPQLPGLRYHCITGNHDWTFTATNGVNVGRAIERFFAENGRNDIRFYGDRGAFLKMHGVVIHLWHPCSGSSYARSYGLQKNIEKYNWIKPQIMLTGHWHVFCHIFERGVHGIACPTFQGGMSAFGKSLGGSPAIGGLILNWTLTEHGTIRDFSVMKRSYFEREMPVSVFNAMDAFPVEPKHR